MTERPVAIPLLNVNEDRVLVVKVLVSEGERLREGTPVALIETTKATVDVIAPCAGVVRKVVAAEGREMKVGEAICHIAVEALEAVAKELQEIEPAASPMPAAGGVHVTAKARLRAAELGVNIAQVPPVAGRVGVAEVEAYASRLLQPAAEAALPTSRKTVIIGGGRHAACILDAAAAAGYEIIGCVDSVKPVGHVVGGGVQVIGPIEMLESLRKEGVTTALIGVGGVTDNRPRARLFDQAVQLGFALPPVIHPAAYVAHGVTIGPGSVVLAQASIGPEARVGVNVIVNQGAIVCHHCRLDDHAHVAPGGILAGGCVMGRGSTLGMGATLFMNVQVGQWCLIYNGVSVVTNVPDNTVIKKDLSTAGD